MSCHRSRVGFLLVAAALFLGLAAGLSAPDAAVAAKRPRETAIRILYTVTAPSGSLTPVAGARYRLVLRDVAKTVSFFGNRPSRVSGAIPTAVFVEHWPGFGFSDVPPNAALTLVATPTGEDTLIFELRRPRYLPGAGILRFDARLLSRASGNLAHYQNDLRDDIPRRFDDVSSSSTTRPVR